MTDRKYVPDWLAAADRTFTGALREELELDTMLAQVKNRVMSRELAADATSARVVPAGLDVVAEAAKGDREAIVQLLVTVRPLLVRYCRARLGRQEGEFANADGLAQEVCLAVLRALPGYRAGHQAFLAFVYGVAQHKVADAHRAARPVLERQALDDRLTGLVRTLPDRQREILVLRLIVGLSAEETGEALGLTAAAVRLRQHRALTRLRRALGTDSGTMSP